MDEVGGAGAAAAAGADVGAAEVEATGARPTEEETLSVDPVLADPPWREAWRRVRAAWSGGGPGTRLAVAAGAVVAAALLGAFLFGIWHVLVGGFLKGNWRAGGFGIALASVAGVLLWIEAAIARRVLPARGRLS
jgi:hypothetical protein